MSRPVRERRRDLAALEPCQHARPVVLQLEDPTVPGERRVAAASQHGAQRGLIQRAARCAEISELGFQHFAEVQFFATLFDVETRVDRAGLLLDNLSSLQR